MSNIGGFNFEQYFSRYKQKGASGASSGHSPKTSGSSVGGGHSGASAGGGVGGNSPSYGSGASSGQGPKTSGSSVGGGAAGGSVGPVSPNQKTETSSSNANTRGYEREEALNRKNYEAVLKSKEAANLIKQFTSFSSNIKGSSLFGGGSGGSSQPSSVSGGGSGGSSKASTKKSTTKSTQSKTGKTNTSGYEKEEALNQANYKKTQSTSTTKTSSNVDNTLTGNYKIDKMKDR